MDKTGKPSADDIEEFRRAVGPVRIIRHDRVEAPRKAVPPRPRRRAAEPGADSFAHCRDSLDETPVQAGDMLFFARPGLRPRQLQRLRRGQLAQDAELDLHGLTAAAARSALSEFIALCREHGKRGVRIIHGKGSVTAGAPVLKNRLNAWLRQHPDVLAFSSAQPRDGGSGALYVLLRSGRA